MVEARQVRESVSELLKGDETGHNMDHIDRVVGLAFCASFLGEKMFQNGLNIWTIIWRHKLEGCTRIG